MRILDEKPSTSRNNQPGPTSDEIPKVTRDLRDAPLPAGSLLIHIGPRKTATTSLQRGLAEDRPELRERGLHYPGARSNHFRPFNRFIAQQDDVELRSLMKKSAKTALPTLLSAELLDYANPAQIRHLKQLWPGPAYVLITLRHYEWLIPSLWQHRVKWGSGTPYPEWVENYFRSGDRGAWHRGRYERLVQRWANEFGADRTFVHTFSTGQTHHPARTVEQLFGLPTHYIATPRSNRGMTLEEAEFFLARNRSSRFADRDRPAWSPRMDQLLANRTPLATETKVVLPADYREVATEWWLATGSALADMKIQQFGAGFATAEARQSAPHPVAEANLDAVAADLIWAMQEMMTTPTSRKPPVQQTPQKPDRFTRLRRRVRAL